MSAANTKESVHLQPVWRNRADFIIGADLPEEGRTEQLWARRLGSHQFEICCIPFFLYDVALGDIVETDHRFSLVRVVRSSGRYVFRIYFSRSTQPKDEVVDRLTDLGAMMEWSSSNLLAIDASDHEHAQRIADFLQEQEDRCHLVFETGRSS